MRASQYEDMSAKNCTPVVTSVLLESFRCGFGVDVRNAMILGTLVLHPG
jgi:hypothetical protein